MITILPMKDRTRAGLIIQTLHDAEADAEVLLMSDGSNELGYVVIDMISSVIRMLKMEVFGCHDFTNLKEQNRMCADSLMRATASYGATVGAYQIESQIDGLECFLKSVGFSTSENKLVSPLSNFIKICNH